MKIVLLCCLVTLCFHGAFGAVFWDLLHSEEVNGRTVRYCEYKGLRLLPGPRIRFKDYDDCVRCTCNKGGLSCASMAPSVMVPDNAVCTTVRIRCRNFWRMKNNPKKRCPKRLRPKQISMVGK